MLEDIRLSFKGIWAHKMRSFLTMLGIIVGVAAVIAVVSTITGTNEQIKNNLIGDGSNTVKIELYQDNWPADFSYSDVPSGIPELGKELSEDILDINGAENVTFIHKRDYCDNVFYLNNQLNGDSIYGIDENYFDTVGMQLVHGRGFSQKDMTGQQKVVIIDTTILSSIFGGKEAIGKTLDIQGEPFTIIGIVDKRSAFEPVITSVEDYYTYAGNQQGGLYVPDQMWPLLFRFDEPRNCIVKASSVDDMARIGKETADILNSYLSVGEEASIEYKGTNLADEAAEIQQLSASTNVLLIGIASISLLVGGIGVMNIMLVSVTERTREIGLKKALGARKNRIRRQFLTESVILSGLGGLLGVIAGILLSKVISMIALIPTAISIPAILIAVVFSMVIGIIFGMVPSVKASNLNPIEALGYE